MFREAKVRKEETYRAMEKFCEADDTDHEKLKEVFQSTIKIQDRINELMGLQGAPEELMDRIDSMTTEEWANMGFAVGAFLVPMGMTMASKFLIGVMGITFGPVYLAVVLGGVALQTYVTMSEKNMKLRADVMARNAHTMGELGFTTTDAWDALARSWIFTIIEGVSIVPLLGMALQGIKVSTKVTKSIIVETMKNSTKLGLKQAYARAKEGAKIVADEADVDLAKIVLGLDSYSSIAKEFFSGSKVEKLMKEIPRGLPEDRIIHYQDEIQELKRLVDLKKIDEVTYGKSLKKLVSDASKEFKKLNGGVSSYVAKTSTDLSFDVIDDGAVKALKNILKNPRSMKSFMDTYMKKFDVPMKKFSGVRKTNLKGETKLSGVEKAHERYLKAKNDGYMLGTNWIRTAWYENTYNLAKNKDAFLRIQNDLRTLPESEFEDYLRKNLDELTDLFVKAPMRLPLDIPYLFIQGGPHLGVRIPGIHSMGEAVIVRKIMNARARLTAESSKVMAREALGLSKAMAADEGTKVFKGLFSSARKEAELMDGPEKELLEETMRRLKVKIGKALKDSLEKNEKFLKLAKENNLDVFTAKGGLHQGKLKAAMFNPKTIKEENIMNVGFSMIDHKKLFNLEEIEFIAYKVMRNNMTSANLSSVEKLVTALQTLMMKENLGQVELF